ncbi:MAG TPA: hypothetical protein LFW21_01365 [Rickettsia endosymbiont of Pyrocoelia pectoralis]|nr:hypothetical protein [Rickettsia endosymbiont of Pyrocoelia pectoralis]
MADIKNELRKKFSDLKEKFNNAYTRSHIDTILGELGTLQLEAASYGLNFDISALQQAGEAKAKNFEVEQSIDKAQKQEEEFLKAERLQILAEKEKEITQRMALLNHSHNQFIEKIDKNIKQLKEHDEHIEHVTNKLEKEKIVDHEKLEAGILNHEEIASKHKDHKEYYEHQNKINDLHTKVHEKLNVLNKEITNIKQQLQRKDLTPEKIDELKQDLESQQEKLNKFKSHAENLNKKKKEANERINKYEKAREVQSEKIKKLGDAIKTHHGKDTEAYHKYKVLKNQHRAISAEGVVKDVNLHNKVLTNIKADKIKKQATVAHNIGSLQPSRTPNNSKDSKTRGI